MIEDISSQEETSYNLFTLSFTDILNSVKDKKAKHLNV